MTDAVLDLSHTALPRQIQGNLIAYMRLFNGLSGVSEGDDGETYWIVSGKPAPGNIILQVGLAADADRVEVQLDDLFAQIGRHTDEIGWFVFPGDQPADLGQRLEARGLPGGRAGNWLWIDRKKLVTPPALPDNALPNNFHIEQVRDDGMMREWLLASEAGFGGELEIFYDAYARHGYEPDALSLHYIGYLGDTPVTSATLLDAGGAASIYDLSTPDVFRQQGFGGAITHALMQEIHRRGYNETWIWSSDMAQTLYRKLGYVDADFGIREHVWLKNRVEG